MVGEIDDPGYVRPRRLTAGLISRATRASRRFNIIRGSPNGFIRYSMRAELDALFEEPRLRAHIAGRPFRERTRINPPYSIPDCQKIVAGCGRAVKSRYPSDFETGKKYQIEFFILNDPAALMLIFRRAVNTGKRADSLREQPPRQSLRLWSREDAFWDPFWWQRNHRHRSGADDDRNAPT